MFVDVKITNIVALWRCVQICNVILPIAGTKKGFTNGCGNVTTVLDYIVVYTLIIITLNMTLKNVWNAENLSIKNIALNIHLIRFIWIRCLSDYRTTIEHLF